MKSLIKFAIGAAIAGALVNMLRREQSRRRVSESRDEQATDVGPDSSYDANLVADTNSVGDERAMREPQPQDWRGAQNVLE